MADLTTETSSVDDVGRPLDDDTQPTEETVVVRSVSDRSRKYVANDLKPDRLSRVLRSADQGDICEQSSLFDDMLDRDLHLLSMYTKRTSAVARMPWSVKPGDDTPAAIRSAEFVNDVLKTLKMRRMIVQQMSSVGYGFGPTEIDWQRKDGDFVPANFENPEHRHFRWDWQQDRLLYTGGIYNVSGIVLAPNKWIVSTFEAKPGHAARRGLFRPSAWAYIFKNYGLKDWMVFTEGYGLPYRKGTYPKNASKEVREKLWKALKTFGNDAAAMFPEGTDIELVFANITGRSDLYRDLIRQMDRYLSVAWTGATLTSGEGERGNQALGKAHQDEFHALSEDDAASIQETIQSDLIGPIHRFNSQPGVAAPIFKIDAKPPVDRKTEAEISEIRARTKLKVAREAGLPMSAKQLREEHDILPPENDDDAVMISTQRDAQGEAPASLDAAAAMATHFLAAARQNKGTSWADKLAANTLDDLEELIRTDLRGLLESVELVDDDADADDIFAAMSRLLPGSASSAINTVLQSAMFVGDLGGRQDGDQR